MQIKSKCVVNTIVVFFMIFTVVYLKYASTVIKYVQTGIKRNNEIIKFVDNNVEGEATDKHVIETLRRYHLQAPPMRSYNIAHTIPYDPSEGQTKILREIFADKQDGIFVECGAVDGVFLSNSLYLERALHWRGLLIEADEDNYNKLETHNRNAYISNTCISPTNQAKVYVFESATHMKDQYWWVKGTGKIAAGNSSKNYKRKFQVQCFPFYTFMLALNVTVIDYLSLDVEGSELEILKTIPYDTIEIKVISVEWQHFNKEKIKETDLEEFLESKGYHQYLSENIELKPYEKIFIRNGVSLNHLKNR